MSISWVKTTELWQGGDVTITQIHFFNTMDMDPNVNFVRSKSWLSIDRIAQFCSSIVLDPSVNPPLGLAYTMDHEVIPKPSKICDWMLNLSRDHFSLHQGKKN